MSSFLQRIVFRFRGLKGRWSRPQSAGRCASFSPERIASHADYRQRLERMTDEARRRAEFERELARAGETIPSSGHCCVCHQDVTFHSDLAYGFPNADGSLSPNWRERVVCPVCRLNNRMRAAIHFFQSQCAPQAGSALYVTEQTTPLFTWLKGHYDKTVGSEYLGTQVPFGTLDARGIRNESLTRLSFADASFDYILSFDVFEHIPDYLEGFRESLRCLKPGGALVFTVPFCHSADAHIVRARLSEQGEIEHILPPEYHGDPLSSAGCLCFYHFGWDLLSELRALGFSDAAAYFYWSDEFGYLGGDQLIFMARK